MAKGSGGTGKGSNTNAAKNRRDEYERRARSGARRSRGTPSFNDLANMDIPF